LSKTSVGKLRGMESSLQNFKFAQFQFSLKALEFLNLPEYKGSALRGGFGYAFKKVVCALKSKECPECLLREKCVYSYIFETPPPPTSRLMRKYTAAPHPFVLCPPLEDDRVYEPNEVLQFHLTLIGKAIDYLPYFIYTFEELGEMGLGKGRGKFAIEKVEAIRTAERSKAGEKEKTVIYSGKEKILRNLDNILIYWNHQSFAPAPPTLHLIFLTPTRLKFEGDLTSDLKFHILFRNLLRRISLLSYFHCGEELEVDFRGLIKESEAIQTKKSNLRWYDWERYSGRQDTRMKLGGFIGRVTFSGALDSFWPYLSLGEFIHVGKGSSFGLGKYEILRNSP